MRTDNGSGMVCFYFLLAFKRAGLVRAVSATLASLTRPVGHSITHCSIALRRNSPKKKEFAGQYATPVGLRIWTERLESYITKSCWLVVHNCFQPLRSRRSDHRDFPPCICADPKDASDRVELETDRHGQNSQQARRSRQLLRYPATQSASTVMQIDHGGSPCSRISWQINSDPGLRAAYLGSVLAG